MILISFVSFMGLFLGIGLLSVLKRKNTNYDYLLAGRSVSPMLVGLSGAASTASGFGFTGLIGFGYMVGFSAVWFLLGAFISIGLSLLFFSKRFRVYSKKMKYLSYTEFLAFGVTKRGASKATVKPDRSQKTFQIMLSLLSLFIVVLYAAAQLAAGSKSLYVIFDWPYESGAILGAVIVLLYCWAGGIRASIWTDAVQIIVMMLAMVILAGFAYVEVGGFSGLYSTLLDIDSDLVNILPSDKAFGPYPYIIGCFIFGIGLIGFPHVMVRFMALEKPRHTNRAIGWYLFGYCGFYTAALMVAIFSRALIPDIAMFDKEMALPNLAMDYLPAVFVGFILAGIFASTISTADSLILSGSANLSQDIFTRYRSSHFFIKMCTVAITLLALSAALWGSKSVFDLVMFVIALMSGGLAPLFIIRVMRWPLSVKAGFVTVIIGVSSAVLWRMNGLHNDIFDSAVGFVAAILSYLLFMSCAKLFSPLKNQSI